MLYQRDDGQSNGTALWLGGQCLSLYLVDIARKAVTIREKATASSSSLEAPSHTASRDMPALPRPKAIELGSGIGLTA